MRRFFGTDGDADERAFRDGRTKGGSAAEARGEGAAGTANGELHALYQRGLAAYETGDFRAAVELLSPVAQRAGLASTLGAYYLGQAYAKLGEAALREGRHAEAVAHFTAARRHNPQSAGLSRYLAASYAGLSRFDWAAAELERGEKGGDDECVIRLAHAYARDGRMTRAIETLVDAIEKQPHRADLKMALGLLYASTEHYEDAVCVLTEMVEVAPCDVEARKSLGLALAAAGDHAEAVEHLAVAQRLRPHDACLAQLLTMAIDAARTNCFARGIDVTLAPAENADERSVKVLSEVISQEPELVEAYLGLPASEADAEIFAVLADAIERALEAHPDYADLHYHCARVYERLGRMDEATAELGEALSINPRYVQALIQLGRLFARTDRCMEAAGRLRAAVACGGDYPDVHYLLGELYRREGRKDAARGAYERALELNSNYAAARIAMESLNAA